MGVWMWVCMHISLGTLYSQEALQREREEEERRRKEREKEEAMGGMGGGMPGGMGAGGMPGSPTVIPIMMSCVSLTLSLQVGWGSSSQTQNCCR